MTHKCECSIVKSNSCFLLTELSIKDITGESHQQLHHTSPRAHLEELLARHDADPVGGEQLAVPSLEVALVGVTRLEAQSAVHTVEGSLSRVTSQVLLEKHIVVRVGDYLNE